jgi:4,5-DOPA dioxygenase extradiol
VRFEEEKAAKMTYTPSMNRRRFLQQVGKGLGGMAITSVFGSKAFGGDNPPARMPALFIGHGSPMNAVEDSAFSRAWADVAARIPRPRAILCVSAHWQSKGTQTTAMEQPRTIHDFSGFPQELYAMRYPAPGSPDLAREVEELLSDDKVTLNTDWGLDHGTWAVLCRMWPKADIPVIQLSLDRGRTPGQHYKLGAKLKPLREKGVLVIGSGNMVHNLGLMEWTDEPFDWAARFDQKLKELIEARDHDALMNYPKLGPDAALAIPTNEHYLPLLYALALRNPDEPLKFFAEGVTLGSISMRSLQIGA